MSVFGRVVSRDPEAGFFTGEDATWADLAGASIEEARATTSFNSDKIAGNAVVERIFDKLREETGQEPEAFSLRNPYELNAWELFGESVLKGGNAVTAREAAIRELETRLWALGGDPIDRGLSIELRQEMRAFRLREQRSAYRAEKISAARETMSRANAFTRFTAPLAGGIAASFTDPTQVALGVFSGGTSSTVLSAAVREAAVSVALEGVLQPVIASNYAEAGEDYTARDVAFNLGAAALFGGAIGGGAKAGQKAITETVAYRRARAALEALPDNDPLKLAGSARRRDVVAAGRALVDRLDEAGRAALEKEARDLRDLDQAPPGRDIQEHAGLMADAMTAAEAGVPMPLPPRPRAPGESQMLEGGFNTGRTFMEAGRPVTQQRLDVMTLQTDAGLMQYKSGGDAEGVTKTLRNVRRWSAIQAGELIVWERTDGTRIVADGHQRSGLGRRLVQSGAEERIDVNANVLREADGWTAADVRAIAAKKNIGEGTGDVLDIAQVFRDRPDIIDDSLPVSGEKISDARAIASLSDAAYGMVRNGVVKASDAALVARYAANQEAQAPIIEAIAETRPASATETRILIGQMLEAGFRTEVQESLFGLEQRELSMLKPKMQLVSAVVAQLRADKRVFSILEREADRIEAAGNTLQRSENADRALTAGQVEEILVRLATRRGPVSDRLNAAALAVANGETNRRAAADALAKDMMQLIEEEGAEGLLRPAAPEPAPDAPPVYDRSGARVFDDPDEYADALEAEIDDQTGDMFAPDRADDQPGRALEEALKDPDLVAAVERQANETSTIAPDATFEDLQAMGRTYRLGDRDGNLEEAVDHLADLAKQGAGAEPGRNRRVIIVTGLPGAGKSGVADRLAVSERAALPDADQAKGVIPEYDGGTGAGVVHKESVLLNTEVVARLIDEGTDMIFQTVGKTASSLDKRLNMFKQAGYSVTMLRVNVDETEAARRMISRFKKTGRIVPPDAMRQAARDIGPAWDAVNKEGVSHGQIDISGPKGTFEAGADLPGEIQEALTRAGLRPGEGRGGDVRQRDRTGPGTRESAATEEGLGELFGTVPGDDGAPVRDWRSGVDRVEKMQDRFKECVGQ